MGRSRDPYQIPKAGVEVVPLASLAFINVNGSVGPVSATEFVSESTLGGVLVHAIYQALLTALLTEAMRKRGVIDRPTQARWVERYLLKRELLSALYLGSCCWSSPGWPFPFSVLGIFGVGKASMDLFDAFWDGLTDEQKQELKEVAYDAGVGFHGVFVVNSVK